MKKIGLIIFSMVIGLLGAETSWAAKKGAAEETETADCYKRESPFSYEGEIEDANPTDQKCNAEIPNCKGGCTAYINKGKTLKNKSLKEKTNLKQKNNKQR